MPPATKIKQNVTEDYSIGVLSDARLGTIELGDLPVTICARNVEGVRSDAEAAVGLLGGNVLKNFDVLINYQDKTVTLMNSAEQPIKIPGAKVIPLTMITNQIYTPISLGGGSYIRAGVDTGATYNLGTLAVLKPFIEKSQNMEKFARVRKLRMDEIELSDVVFQIDDGSHPEFPTIVGNDILSRYAITFDYQHKRLIAACLHNPGATPIADLSSGSWLLNEGRLEESIKLFSKVILVEPELRYLALRGRAYAYSRVHAYSKAIEDYSKIIIDKPISSNSLCAAYEGRAWIYEQERNWQNAIQDWDQAIQIRIRALQDAKKEESTYNHSDAMKKRTKEVEKRLARLYVSRSYVYSIRKDFKKSALDLDRAIKLDEADAYAHDVRADLYQRTDKWPEAVTECTEAIRLRPDYADAYNRRGEAYIMLKQYEKGLADLNYAIKLEPNVVYHYVGRAWAFETIGKLDLAERDKATIKKLRVQKTQG